MVDSSGHEEAKYLESMVREGTHNLANRIRGSLQVRGDFCLYKEIPETSEPLKDILFLTFSSDS